MMACYSVCVQYVLLYVPDTLATFAYVDVKQATVPSVDRR